MTHAELLSRMSSREVTHWMALARIRERERQEQEQARR